MSNLESQVDYQPPRTLHEAVSWSNNLNPYEFYSAITGGLPDGADCTPNFKITERQMHLVLKVI